MKHRIAALLVGLTLLVVSGVSLKYAQAAPSAEELCALNPGLHAAITDTLTRWPPTGYEDTDTYRSLMYFWGAVIKDAEWCQNGRGGGVDPDLVERTMRWHYGNASEFMRQYEALVLGPAGAATVPTATPRPAPTATPRPAPTATPRPAPTATSTVVPTPTPSAAPYLRITNASVLSYTSDDNLFASGTVTNEGQRATRDGRVEVVISVVPGWVHGVWNLPLNSPYMRGRELRPGESFRFTNVKLIGAAPPQGFYRWEMAGYSQ